MNRKLTVRTYERKAKKKPSIDISNAALKYPQIPRVSLDKNSSDSFLDHDPFETTFDRIAKGAVVPPLPLNENSSLNISSSDDTTRSIKSSEHTDSSTFHDNVPICSDNVSKMYSNVFQRIARPIRKCRLKKKLDLAMMIKKRNMDCTKAQMVFPNMSQLTRTKYNDTIGVSKHIPMKLQHDSFVINDCTSNISWDKDNSTTEIMNETETKKKILSTNLFATTSSCNDTENLIKDCFVKLVKLKLEEKEEDKKEKIEAEVEINYDRLDKVEVKEEKYEKAKEEKEEEKEKEVEIIDIVENTMFSKKKKRHMICSTPINNKCARISIYPEASPVASHNASHILESKSEYSVISNDNKLDTVSSDQKNCLFTSKYCKTVEKKEEAQVSQLKVAITEIKKELMTRVEYNTKDIITNNQSQSLFSDDTDDKLELESTKATVSSSSVSLHSSDDRKQQLNDVNISECILLTTPCTSMAESTEKKKVLLENNRMETYVKRDSKDIEKHEIFCESNKMINISKQQQNQQQRAFGKNIEENDETLQLQNSIKMTEKRTQHAKLSIPEIILSSDDDNVRPAAITHSKVTESSSIVNRINSPVKKDLKFKRKKIQADNGNNNNCTEESQVFLKPGKSWMRSLSILNNIKDGVNLHELSVGKGKKWRQSVKDVLDMQKQGFSHDRSEKDLYPSYEVPHAKSDVSLLEKSNKVFKSNKFSKRVSIVRVVPSNISSDQISDISLFVDTSEIRTTATKGQEEESDAEYNKISCRTDHVAIILRRCSQECYQPFSECFPDSYLKYCRKIGEGVYGEVFMYQSEDELSVIKIIPIEGEQLVNGESQKKFSEVLSEIIITEELHKLRDGNTYGTDGFVELKSIKCIIGKYPKKLIKLWNKYDNEKKSDNDCPSMFDENQLYIVLELGHGGKDLESYVFQNARETCALFLQIAFTLAMAEKALEFEHRDMHWGNILISKTEVPYVNYTMNGEEIKIPSNNIKASIIDFTLSRMSYNKECCMYNDLALDPSLFTAYGDYQFEVYRLMRDKIQNNWQKFEPYTNILWLHYTLEKMITAVRYEKTRLKIHKVAITRLKELHNLILNYDNAFDFISKCDMMMRLRVELL